MPKERYKPEQIVTLADGMVWRGIPEHVRSERGPAFVAKEPRKWLGKVGTGTPYTGPGSPWEKRLLRELQRKVTG